MNPPAPDDNPGGEPAGAMPMPTTDAADLAGSIDQRNILLLTLGVIYGLILLACALLIGSAGQGGLGFITALSVGYPLYFLPTLIICFVRHRHGPVIFVLNVGTGWTVIGWVVALVWAIRPRWKGRRSKPDRP